MGAFIGYGERGVWASNRERDAFLDWYAAHRCRPHDERWEYCMSEAHRWMGCCIPLNNLIPKGELLEVSDQERSEAILTFGADVAQLLGIISRITRDEWPYTVDSWDAVDWRDSERNIQFPQAES